MKILLAGDWRFDIYEAALAQGFRRNGHTVVPFRWSERLDRGPGPLSRLIGRMERGLRLGPAISRMNRHLVEEVRAERPDLLFLFRADVVYPATVRRAREAMPGLRIATYNNDDPFSPAQPPHRFRHFIRSLPDVDIAYAYRPHNLADLTRAGAPAVALLPPWHDPAIDLPTEPTVEERERFGCDVIFIGHYEPDGRAEMLSALAAAGVRVRLFGTEWPDLSAWPALAGLGPVRPLRGREYRAALCSARIALCFLSKLNRDAYTRRNFEIPATGTFMLSEFSDMLAGWFREGEEAAFFRPGDDLVPLVRRWLDDPDGLARVAAAGRARLLADGHDAGARAASLLAALPRPRVLPER